jgi:hypothetical protein
MGTEEIPRKFWSKSLKRRDHLGGLRVGGSIILKWVLKKEDVSAR